MHLAVAKILHPIIALRSRVCTCLRHGINIPPVAYMMSTMNDITMPSSGGPTPDVILTVALELGCETAHSTKPGMCVVHKAEVCPKAQAQSSGGWDSPSLPTASTGADIQQACSKSKEGVVCAGRQDGTAMEGARSYLELPLDGCPKGTGHKKLIWELPLSPLKLGGFHSNTKPPLWQIHTA